MGRPLEPDKPRRIRQAVEMFRDGVPKPQIERELGLSRETLNRYIRQADAIPDASGIKSQQTRPADTFQPSVDIEETRLGTTIREFRGTIADRAMLARLVPTTQPRLWQIEDGRISPQYVEMRKIAAVFGMSSVELVTAWDEKKGQVKPEALTKACAALRSRIAALEEEEVDSDVLEG